MAEALGFVTEGIPSYSASAKRYVPRGGRPLTKTPSKGLPPVADVLKQPTEVAMAKRRKKATEQEPVKEEEEPTDKQIASANRKVHTKKTVRGETAKETKEFDQEVERTMGKKRVGAEGGIEGLKAKIRAAGQRSRR